jgi:hypothetical protein
LCHTAAIALAPVLSVAAVSPHLCKAATSAWLQTRGLVADGRSRVTDLVDSEGKGIGKQSRPPAVRRHARAEVPDHLARSNASSRTTASDVAASMDAFTHPTAVTDRAEWYARVRSTAARLARICRLRAATLGGI